MASREIFLVFRDRLVPRSEAHFLRRMYAGFQQLDPYWLGSRIDAGLADLGATPHLLGGAVSQALFKQTGWVPGAANLMALRPRLLHAHFGRGGALALPIAKRLGIPLVVTFHGGDATKATHYRRRLIPTLYQRRRRAMLEYASAIICVSGFIRDALLARGFPSGKLMVLHNGVDMPAARPVPQPPATPYVLFAGRFVAKKGIADLLAAMRILATNGTPVGLHLIGDGPEEGAMRAAATGIPGVEFLGWRGNDEVRQRMQHALAVCVPSVTAPDGDSEGLPTVAIEAMAQGTPVIGTNHAGIVEAVRDEQTGLLVPQGDPTALANAIRRLANDPNLRAGLGEAAWREADAHFNAMTQSRQLEEFFLTLRRQNA